MGINMPKEDQRFSYFLHYTQEREREKNFKRKMCVFLVFFIFLHAASHYTTHSISEALLFQLSHRQNV